MAWEDRTPFDAIEHQFNIKENQVRKIMRENLSDRSFKLWRKRVKGRCTLDGTIVSDDQHTMRAAKWANWPQSAVAN